MSSVVLIGFTAYCEYQMVAVVEPGHNQHSNLSQNCNSTAAGRRMHRLVCSIDWKDHLFFLAFDSSSTTTATAGGQDTRFTDQTSRWFWLVFNSSGTAEVQGIYSAVMVMTDHLSFLAFSSFGSSNLGTLDSGMHSLEEYFTASSLIRSDSQRLLLSQPRIAVSWAVSRSFRLGLGLSFGFDCSRRSSDFDFTIRYERLAFDVASPA